jgi:hypothetical protein
MMVFAADGEEPPPVHVASSVNDDGLLRLELFLTGGSI